jgi:hypothetical protein
MAMSRQKLFTDFLEQRFRVIARPVVHWQAESFGSNINRLYRQPSNSKSSKALEVGNGPFQVVVLEDVSPNYRFFRQNSGRVKPSNINVIQAKAELRRLVDVDYEFAVHSSNSLDEFWHDARLIFGKSLWSILENPRLTFSGGSFVNPPPGSGGWNSLSELLEFVSLQSDFVLYKSQSLDDVDKSLKEGKDIDILVRNLHGFAAATGGEANFLERRVPQIWVTVANQRILLDLRVVGDNCWDARWQQSGFASAKVAEDYGSFLTIEDWFFLRLYFLIGYKPSIRVDADSNLGKVAAQIFDEDTASDLFTDPKCASSILDGYLLDKGYRYTKSVWKHEHLNDRVARYSDPELLPKSYVGVGFGLRRAVRLARRRVGNFKRSLNI